MSLKKSTKGAVILFFFAIFVILIWFFVKPFFDEYSMRSSSDAARDAVNIRIGGDNYIGYWFINSHEMRKIAAKKGIRINFTDDGGIYEERLKKFADGQYECIVLPVNSYLQHGKKWNYPGVIVAAISESKGADGVAGLNISSQNINGLNDPSLTFVYTADSPSEFLLDLTIHDFDLDKLKTSDTWRKEVSSSEEVYKMAKKEQGDIFVAWEPDLSRILDLDNMNYIFGSDNFRGYIIDVFVFNRKFVKNERNALINFFNTYYQVMNIYANNKEQMKDEIEKATQLKEEKVELLLNKIEWYDLNENCSQMFGIAIGAGTFANDGIINSIISCTDVLIDAGVFTIDPLSGDPYLIVDSSILDELTKNLNVTTINRKDNQEFKFEKLDDQQWKSLPVVGTFKVRDITFQSWNNNLDPDGEKTVDKTAALLINNYPNYRIIIRGHTASGGDERLNKQRSLERAQAIAQRLIAVYGIDPTRIRAEGAGSDIPPEKKVNESFRAYQYRMNRVEFIALRENPF